MPTLLLEFSFKNVPVQTKVNKKHLWFDSKENRMYEYWGGNLSFAWNHEEGRLKPKVSFKLNPQTKKYDPIIDDAFETSWKLANNRAEIENWVRQIGSRFDVEINDAESSNKGIAVDVGKDVLSIIEYALERYGIRFSEIEDGKTVRQDS